MIKTKRCREYIIEKACFSTDDYRRCWETERNNYYPFKQFWEIISSEYTAVQIT